MDSLSPQVVSAVKLPVLNPNEFDLWKMTIEQYFLMTDYSLWEVILNGDSPVPTRVVEGVLQPVAPTTAEQRLARKNELKARGTLLMALPDKHQLKFNSHKDAKTLMEAIEKIFKGNIETKKIDVDYLEEMDLRWQMAMLTMRARRFLQKTGKNLGANGPTSMGFDMSKVECYNCHRKRHFSRGIGSYDWSYQGEEEPANYALIAFSSSHSSFDNEVPSCSKACTKAYAQLHTQYDKLTDEFRKSQFNVISYQIGLESIEARLLVYEQNESVFNENIKLLNIKVQLRDTALVTLRQKLEKAEQERDDLKLKSDKFQPSGGYHVVPPPITGSFMPPKPDLVFNNTPLSHTTRPSAPIIEDWVSDSEDESETKAPQFVPSFVQSSEQVKSPKHTVQPIKTSIPATTPALASPKSTSSGKRRNRKTNGSTHTKELCTQGPVSAVVPIIMMTRPRLAHPIVTKYKPPIRRHITRILSPKTSNSPLRVTAHQAPVGNLEYALKDKKEIDSGCSRNLAGNMSYLSDFEELNGGYVAFGGNPKGGKISGKGKIKTVLLRVPMENNMYNVNLKKIVTSGDLTCLFAKATIDESNLWHRRLGHINFKTINKLVKGNLVRGLPTKVFGNENTCVACKKGKQYRASCKTKPISSVDQPFFRLHMDLFGPTFIKILKKKSYCLVVADDDSRFTWVFFLATKDETSPILKTFITGLENQLSLKVKVIKSDNGTEFKNFDLNQFCGMKGIQTPSIGFMRPFGYPVTILNTLDSLGKFKGKVDEGFLVGYSVNIKAFRVFNSRTRIVHVTLHMNFLENMPNIAGNQTNLSAGFQDKFEAKKAGEEIDQQYVLFPMWSSGSINPQNNDEDAAFDGKEHDFDVKKPKSKVILSPSSSAQSRKLDDMTKKKVKGKKLEYITYSDDQNVVGVEADFNNLETSITEEPKRVHQALKDPS
nr:putative ribonuclease H-like domain-containing protein [Tanacetum cinerariifolium]